MGIGRTLLLAAAKSDALNRFATKSKVVKRATSAFMPGETMEAGLYAGVEIARSGRSILYTRLGEALTDIRDADGVRDHYLALFAEIKARGLPAQVSVKPTQLGFDQSLEKCTEHCVALAEAAERSGSALWLDMEDSTTVDRTLELYRAVRSRHTKAGIAIQAYLYRSPKDVEALLALNPTIRLVKGAYAEPASVAYPKKADTDSAYEAIATQMLEGAKKGTCHAIFGTHDMPLLRRIISKAKSLGVTPGAYEIHMLYGIRDAEQRTLVADGQTVATLISYGEAWYRWYMRRLAERPANVGFVVRSMFG